MERNAESWMPIFAISISQHNMTQADPLKVKAPRCKAPSYFTVNFTISMQPKVYTSNTDP